MDTLLTILQVIGGVFCFVCLVIGYSFIFLLIRIGMKKYFKEKENEESVL